MTGHIVRISGGDISYDSIDYNSIFAIGLMLFLMTLGLNVISRALCAASGRNTNDGSEQRKDTAGSFYPEGEEDQAFVIAVIAGVELFWRLTFQAATLVGIIALTALLYNMINGAFGYVAMQNKIDPSSLAVDGVAVRGSAQGNVDPRFWRITSPPG